MRKSAIYLRSSDFLADNATKGNTRKAERKKRPAEVSLRFTVPPFVPPSGSKKPERNGTHKRFGFVPPCVPFETY
jgi:hypothetical protein